MCGTHMTPSTNNLIDVKLSLHEEEVIFPIRADTGAEATVIGYDIYMEKLKHKFQLRPPQHYIKIAGIDGKPLSQVGTLLLNIELGGRVVQQETVYICRNVNDAYISLDTCKNLGIISKYFPLPPPGNSTRPEINKKNRRFPIKKLRPIRNNEEVLIQNPVTKKWNKSGTVCGHVKDKYCIKVHYTGRVRWTNRKFIRPATLSRTPSTQSLNESKYQDEDEAALVEDLKRFKNYYHGAAYF